MEGKFTVNIAVFFQNDNLEIELDKAKEYDCKFNQRIRLGELIPTKFSAFSKVPVLGSIFAPKDRWWNFSSLQYETESNILKVLDLLIDYGFVWLLNIKK